MAVTRWLGRAVAAAVLLGSVIPAVRALGPVGARERLLTSPADRAKLAARLEAEIPRLMRDGDVPGLSIAVIRDSKVLWSRGFGVTSAETRAPVDEETVFEAASLSKPLFAYAVLKLADTGALDLDAPLSRYLTEAYVEGDARLESITARREPRRRSADRIGRMPPPVCTRPQPTMRSS